MKQKQARRWVGVAIALAAPALIALLRPALVEAQLGPELRSSPIVLTATYNEDTGISMESTLLVWGNRTDFALGFSTGSSSTYTRRTLVGPGGATLEYQLRNPVEENRVVTDLDGITPDRGPIYGSIRGGGNIPREEPFPFLVTSPMGQHTLPAGDYTDTVRLVLYRTDPNQRNPVYIEEQSVTLVFTVPASVALSVVQPGEEFDPLSDSAHLDFGPLATGQFKEVDLWVRARVNYELTVFSPNNGVMAMVGESDGSEAPYTMFVNGTPRSLAEGTREIARGGPTDGTVYRLRFTIGQVENLTSGIYEDNLTVTVRAQ